MVRVKNIGDVVRIEAIGLDGEARVRYIVPHTDEEQAMAEAGLRRLLERTLNAKKLNAKRRRKCLTRFGGANGSGL
jgi:hypothetical protein